MQRLQIAYTKDFTPSSIDTVI